MVKIIEGVIDRRILVNYRIDPHYLEKILPPPFKPRLIKGYGMGGICLIRFKKMRPIWLPSIIGTSSENGTHRFCVEWKENGKWHSGIYVKKRFTNSRLHEFMGDKIFPGALNFSHFKASEKNGHYSVSFKSKDGEYTYVEAHEVHHFPKDSLFKTIEEASEDFRKDQIGYSPDRQKNQFKGVKLNTNCWAVSPLSLKTVKSSLFSDQNLFPKGSIEVDHVLLMKNIAHSWENIGAICNS